MWPHFSSPVYLVLPLRAMRNYLDFKHIVDSSCLAQHLEQQRSSCPPLRRACLIVWFHRVFTVPGQILSSPFLSLARKMLLRFHFSSGSFPGCHYKLCFLLEQGYWKIFHYIHLWIIVQSVWCQSPFQFPSSASPSYFAPFLTLL